MLHIPIPAQGIETAASYFSNNLAERPASHWGPVNR